MKILRLLQVQSQDRDLQWLKDSINSAIELELATIPVYLCAWWSIKDPNNIASSLVRSVLIEEMLHMGFMCNMLVAIGGMPKISSVLPTYPGALPGGVRPELTVYLAGMSKQYLSDVCMPIETPEYLDPLFSASDTKYETIGAFYDAILAAFKTLQPSLNKSTQLSTTLGKLELFEMATIDDVEKAINEIKEQGEGSQDHPDEWGFETGQEEASKTSPDDWAFGKNLAHYYKFAEIFYEKTYILDKETNKWDYIGAPIPFPDTYPMTTIPEGGWSNPKVPPQGWSKPTQEVQDLLYKFNAIFQTVLANLETAWTTGDEQYLNTGINAMFILKDLAVQLMQIPLPDGSGYYGPDFQLPAG